MSQQIYSSSIVRPKAVRALTGLSRSTLWRLCRRGEFPQPLKLTARLIGWRAAEVQHWLDSRERSGSAVTEEKAEISETRVNLRAGDRHRCENPRVRKRRSPQAGDSPSDGSPERGTAQGTNGTLHKVSSVDEAATVLTKRSRETEGGER